MLRKYRVIGVAGIMPKDKIVIPGEIAELDDDDPRLPGWLAEGTLAEVGVPTSEKNNNRRPKSKTRRKTTPAEKAAPKAPPKPEKSKVKRPIDSAPPAVSENESTEGA